MSPQKTGFLDVIEIIEQITSELPNIPSIEHLFETYPEQTR